MSAYPNSPPWTIILAAGDGTRLRPLTRALHGEDLPKQFASIQAGRSLLQSTLDRCLRWSPEERTIVVVAEDRLDLARNQLTSHRSIHLIAQPRNLGTGPGVLLPMTRILAQDRSARVVVVPSDHYVRDVEPFVGCVAHADQLAHERHALVLVGAVADRAETQYGWIVPQGCGPAPLVGRFCEKPPFQLASQLLRQGALWNTFIMAGSAKRFWALACAYLPAQASLFADYRRAVGSPRESWVLAKIYNQMPTADFSRDLLQHAPELRVVPLSACGWSDWGTPRRVFTSLRGSEDFTALVHRLRSGRSHSTTELEWAARPRV